MRSAPILAFCLPLLLAGVAHADPRADAPAAEQAPPFEKGGPEVGASFFGQMASRRLGPGFGVAVEAGWGFRIGRGALNLAIRPRYAYYGLGASDALSCAQGDVPCPLNAPLFVSTTTAHEWAVGVPIAYRLHEISDMIPFLGVAPEFMVLRATESADPQLVEHTITTRSATKTTFAASLFAGLLIPMGKTSGIDLQGGYRFSPKVDLPGGSSALAGGFCMVGWHTTL